MTAHDGHCPAIRITVPTNTAPCQCALIREVRIDEAKRMNKRWRTQVLDNERERMRLDLLADLRAKVEALPHADTCGWWIRNRSSLSAQPDYCDCMRADVLALFDGSSDE